MKISALLVLYANLNPVLGAYSTRTLFNICTTKLGSTSKSPVPTSTKFGTLTLTAKQWVTSTPSKVVTPKPVTTTTTVVITKTATTTAPQVTETFETTTWSTTTFTEETVTTSTTTFITTEFSTTTSTTTIAASPGFIPVRSSIPNSVKRRKVSRIVKEEPRAEGALLRGGPKRYPTSVLCGGLKALITTKTYTVTARKTTTRTAATPTLTRTASTTTTSTSTIIPPNTSSTITIISTTSTTLTQTSTVGVSETSATTVIVEAPAATYYAACDASNIVHTINGVPITNGQVNSGITRTLASPGTPYDCCVACVTRDDCAGTFFFGNTCGLASFGDGRVCSQSNVAVTYWTREGEPDPIYISNGYCGVSNVL